VSKMGEGPLTRFMRVKRPVARDEGLLVEHLDDETVIYDERTKEAHCLSPLASVVFANCDGETSIDQLAALATERLDQPVDQDGVIEALTELQDRDLLAVPPRGDFTRRQMIGKSAAVAAGAAFAGPLITSIAAPASAAAASAFCGDLLCCPCCQATFDKQECCFIANVTVNCQCTGNRNVPSPAPKNAKWCKPAGSSAPDDSVCENFVYPNKSTPGTGGFDSWCSPHQAEDGHCSTCK
jgi:hypothetical protein